MADSILPSDLSNGRAVAKPFMPVSAIDDRKAVYVSREADTQLFDLLSEGRHCNLHAGRQSGKTSLLRKVRRQLEALGDLCCEINCSLYFIQSPFGEAVKHVAASLQSEIRLQLSDHRLPTLRVRKRENPSKFFVRILDHLAANAPTGKRIFVMLDELDSLTVHSPGELVDFFLHLREYIQNQASHQPRVVLLFVSVLTLQEMIMEYHSGGTGIASLANVPLCPFANTVKVRRQMEEQGFPGQADDTIDKLLTRVIDLTGGQPYLTSLFARELQCSDDPETRLTFVADEAVKEPRSLVTNHLNGIDKQLTDMGLRLFSLVQIYKEIHQQSETVRGRRNTQIIGTLENLGLIRRETTGHYRVSNPIYYARLTPDWAENLVNQYEKLSGSRFRTRQRLGCTFNRKVALLMVGGTMGMITEKGQSHFMGAQQRIERFIEEELNQVTPVQPFFLWELDGINVTPKNWLNIAQWIDQRRDEYEGFVIAHGTDTLAYTASAVAFMLGRGLNRPVVFTGSQTTIDQLHGDTRQNFFRAVYAAANDHAIPEVQIFFGDRVMRAVRAEKSDDRTYDGFESPGWPLLARVTENYLVNQFALDTKHQQRIPYHFQPYIADSIMLITLAPGIQPEPYMEIIQLLHDRGKPLNGILITTPGVGNIPSEDPFNFRLLIQEAISLGIPVLIASQVPINPYTQDQYEMASTPAKYGAIPAGNLTLAAALTKFAWVIGCVRHEMGAEAIADPENKLKEIKTRMRTIYIGEEGEYGEQLQRSHPGDK
ncbi:MAG: asparaginase [Magnetococcales bacterium]|nr:asparaginase [Magnetococcales bacterium]